MGKLHGVPDLPPHYLPREVDLAGLKQKLLGGSANVGITGQSWAVGVQGMGGIGKTVLAVALAHDSEIRQKFPHGVYWLTVGQNPNLLELQNQLLRDRFGIPVPRNCPACEQRSWPTKNAQRTNCRHLDIGLGVRPDRGWQKTRTVG
jgi:hypothetical protein